MLRNGGTGRRCVGALRHGRGDVQAVAGSVYAGEYYVHNSLEILQEKLIRETGTSGGDRRVGRVVGCMEENW